MKLFFMIFLLFMSQQEPPRVPQHPFMSGNIHNDAYMSDVYWHDGPTGENLEVITGAASGDCVSMAFDNAGRIIALCLWIDAATLNLIDAQTLDVLDSLELPAREVESLTDFPAGSYFYLDHEGRAMIPTIDRTVWKVAVNEAGTFEQEYVYDLTDAIPESDMIGSVLPDFSGNLWFVTRNGMVGVLNMETEAVASLTLDNEQITNSFAVDETGGVFIASDHALYRFDADENGAPVLTWREVYDRGERHKPGQAGQGTGSTPTLMGESFITIADNAEHMKVLVYRRQPEVEGSRLVCSERVFEPGEGATENSLIATDRSIIVENNYGYFGPRSTLLGQSTSPGMTRIDVDEDGNCRTVWTSNERIPNVVSKLSVTNGLVYTYTKDTGSDNWYFTALDFETGETVLKQLTGAGLPYNSHYAGLYLGPDGTAYVGVVRGLIAIR